MSKPHLALLLERASRVVADRLTRDIGLDGVTSDHWRVLRHLSDGAGHAMGELAEREGVPLATFDEPVIKAFPRLAMRPRKLPGA